MYNHIHIVVIQKAFFLYLYILFLIVCGALHITGSVSSKYSCGTQDDDGDLIVQTCINFVIATTRTETKRTTHRTELKPDINFNLDRAVPYKDYEWERMRNEGFCIPGAARWKGDWLRSGQSTISTSTSLKCNARPERRTSANSSRGGTCSWQDSIFC